MEPQQNQAESVIAPLKKVTPLSKYLAMMLFIFMPFLGGWIGYTLAPVEIIEVEREITINKVSNGNRQIDSDVTGISTSGGAEKEITQIVPQNQISIDNLDVSKPYRSINNFTISVPNNTSVSESQQTADSSGISTFSGDFGELCISTGYGCGGFGLQGWVGGNTILKTESGIELTFAVWRPEEGGNQVLMIMTSWNPISAIPTSEWELHIDTTEEQLAVVETIIGSLKFEI